jgi:conjugal transfer pilus assembly protein TraD
MNDQSGELSNGFGNLGLYVVALFLVFGVLARIEPEFIEFWKGHLMAIVAASSGFLALGLAWLSFLLWNKHCDRAYEKAITTKDETSVYLGTNPTGEEIHLKRRFRTMHTQVIGTTSAGKTESIILPWAVRDMETGAGLLMIDGKSDRSFLDKLYAYAVKTGREKDFKLFSFSEISKSTPFNPLLSGTAPEIAERVFSSFTFENEYYRNVQYKIFQLLIGVISKAGKKPNFRLIHQLLTNPDQLKILADETQDNGLQDQVIAFLKESPRDRAEKLSGLEACVSHFANGDLAKLFDAETGGIQFDEALRNNHICYFQLPSMYFPFLAEATGKLVLQTFQNAVAKRHLAVNKNVGFFSCYLDDFQDYIYPGFSALLNKARSANIGVVFSHQALGDLDKVSPAFRNVVLTNTNVKCVMRNNDPDTADYFSNSFGTSTTEKVTERQTTSLFGNSKTGESSVRAVEAYKVHPNEIKSLGVGQGFVTIPHMKGVKTLKVAFQRRPDLPAREIPNWIAPTQNTEQIVINKVSQGEKQTRDLI